MRFPRKPNPAVIFSLSSNPTIANSSRGRASAWHSINVHFKHANLLAVGDTTYAYLVEMLQTCFLANPNLIDASCVQKPTKANNISDYNFIFIDEMHLAASNF